MRWFRARLPDPLSNPLRRFIRQNQNLPAVPVAEVLREGGQVSGFRVVVTPGHARGHVSLLRDADGLLFTADAFGYLPRRVRVGVVKPFCTDPPLAKRSAEKLLGEDFATVMYPFRTRAYRLAVLFEVIGIPVAAMVLSAAGHPEAVVSAVATVVGLHFFGLIPAFESRRFAARRSWWGCSPCCCHPARGPGRIRGA